MVKLYNGPSFIDKWGILRKIININFIRINIFIEYIKSVIDSRRIFLFP